MIKLNECSSQTEPTRNFRNFRNIPEIESFYRFINDNDLRREAKIVLEHVLNQMKANRKKKKLKKNLQ